MARDMEKRCMGLADRMAAWHGTLCFIFGHSGSDFIGYQYTAGFAPVSCHTYLCLFGGFIGRLLGGPWMKCRGLFWGLGCGLLLLLSEVLVGICLLTPSFQSGQAMTKALAMVISGALGGLWGANREEKIK